MPQTVQSGDDVTALMTAPANTPAPKSGDDVTALMQNAPRMNFAIVNGQRVPVDDADEPNTIGTVVKHVGQQINPLSMVQALGQAITHPIDTTTAIGTAQGALFDKAKASYEKGDYATAARHFVDYLIPLVGPALDKSSDEMQAGKWAAGGGDAIGLGLALFGPKALQNVAAARYPLAASPAATALKPASPLVQFARQRDVPIDAATVSDNLAVKGTQALADRSLGGSLVATPAKSAQAAAMTRVGGELANETGAAAATPEQAGASLRDALMTKIAGHTQAANTAYDTVRSLEGPQTTVDLAGAKKILRPLYDQMKRQMPLTQQQANPGLKAIENIVTGPDSGPLSQVDRDLSTIKTIAREQGGLAKMAVKTLDSAVTQAAARGGPDVFDALQQGRQATVAKYAASDVLDSLHDEPVRTIAKLTAPKDSAIQSLRAVTQQVPQQAAEIARGYLEDLMAKPQRVADWRKLGSETKAILFPKAGQAQALDQFFNLADRISKTNVNPSGSGYIASLGAQGAMLWAEPLSGAALQISGAALAKLLRSPMAINAVTRGMSLPQTAPIAVRAATTASLVRAAQAAGVDLALPKAADRQPTARQTP